MVAAFGRAQPHGEHYQGLLQRAAAEQWSLVTTWPCVVEANYLLAPPQRYALMRWVAAGGVTVFPFGQEALETMVELMRKYTEAPRTEMDFADASIVWLAADTGVLQVMTLDQRDFTRYRLPDGRAFEVL
jgi:predicted nucleic acid-binding protein